MQQMSEEAASRLVNKFNSTFPPGSKCHWRSIGKKGVPYELVTVASAAFLMSGQPVAMFEEKRGCCSIAENFMLYNIIPSSEPEQDPEPVDLLIFCPNCGKQHIDRPDSPRSRCPTCDSPSPERHPAMQFEGEVQPCKDSFH